MSRSRLLRSSIPRIVVSLGVLVAVGTAPPVAGATTAESMGSTIDRYLDHLVSDVDTPGLAVAVLDRDTTTTHLTGRDGDGHDIATDTPFLIGSVAKSMTATAVLALVRDGRLRLDDRIGAALPWSPVPDATVTQLLTHTAGFTSGDGLAVSERFDNAPGAVTRAARELRHSGRSGRYAYSDANYLMLGALIEHVTGRPYAATLHDTVLVPLGMSSTTASADTARVSAGHRIWWGTPVRYDPGFDESGGPFGYVASTLGDMVVYARAQMGRDPGALDPSTLGELHRPRVRSGDDSYAFGWRTTPSEHGVVVHHTGATPGYFAHVMVRSDGRGVVMLANAYSESRAPTLAAAAGDVLEILDGGAPAITPGDGVLAAVPWALGVVSILGALAVAAGLRHPPGRRTRVAAALGALLVVGASLSAPTLLGATVRQLWFWAPDVVVGLAAVALTWGAVSVVVAVRPAHGDLKWWSGRVRPRARAHD
ncbi:serine hydrolase domain-containing protein [Williamsia sp. MIQD14]|uniref:serine hydrolase domain-containing protein n=1 Tax=Williamsia sp. MIQD14 TaxID=3425703 RepID=UPI003DA064C3